MAAEIREEPARARGKAGPKQARPSPDPAPGGPFVEVGGYMVVPAADLDEAIHVAPECPGLMHPRSGVESIEIRIPG